MTTRMYTNFEPYLNNISNNTNNQLLALIQQTSIATNYLPGTLILMAIAIIIFVVLKSRNVPTPTAFAATAFAHMILAVIIFPLQIIHEIHFLIALIAVPLTAIALWLSSR